MKIYELNKFQIIALEIFLSFIFCESFEFLISKIKAVLTNRKHDIMVGKFSFKGKPYLLL